ncbi:MAG: flagellar basal body-associated FliL family protein [Hydrogenophaga sp.]|nr:flagellar basal body-associated FliL family protein [Hydrogenophaga sp.]
MADEDTEVEGKKKSPIVKIIVIVLLVLILLAGTIVGTLFFAGAFDAKDEKTAEEQLTSLEEKAAAEKAAADPNAPPAPGAEPTRVQKDSPELTRFVQTATEIEREFLANLTNSRKVIQVQIAIMTTYDDRVFKNVEKHEFALRSATLDVLRQVTDQELETPTFRKDLAEKIRTEMNAVLEKFEDFGGIEEVYFTTFVVQ